MNRKDIPEWDWTDYQYYPEDEHLTRAQLNQKIITDPVYWCKYELRFNPIEFDNEQYLERLALIKAAGYDESYYPRSKASQAEFIRQSCLPNMRYIITAAGRRGGKTTALTGIATYLLFKIFSWNNPPIDDWNIVLFAHREVHTQKVILKGIKNRVLSSKNLWKYMKRDTVDTLEFVNNTNIYTVPATDEEKMRGITRAIVLIGDEGRYVADDSFNVIMPIINEHPIIQLRDGAFKRVRPRLIVISTPEGFNNWFAKRWMMANDVNSPADQVALRWHSLDNPYQDAQDIINDIELDPLFWRQEYAAEFLATSGAFWTPALLDQCTPGLKDTDDKPTLTLSLEGVHGARYYWGIDWGATNDSTVIWVLEDVGGKGITKFVKEFIKTEYDEQLRYIEQLARYLPPVLVRADRAGRAQNNHLARTLKLPLDPVDGQYMGKEWKTQAFSNVKMLMQMKRLFFPYIRKHREQMLGLNVTRTQGGYLSFSDKAVGHDDYVDAMVLAASCLNLYGGYRPQIRIEGMRPDVDAELEYYQMDGRGTGYQPKFKRVL